MSDPLSADGLRAIARRARIAGNARTAGQDPAGLPALAAAILDCEDLTREDLTLLLWDFQRAVQAEVRYSAAQGDDPTLGGPVARLAAIPEGARETAARIVNQTHASGLTVYPLPAPLALRLTCEIGEALFAIAAPDVP